MVKLFGFQIHEKIIYFVIYLAITYIIYRILKSALNNIFNMRMKNGKSNARKEKTLKSITDNVLKYALYIIVLLIILGSLGVNTAAIVAGVGAIGLIIGLAFQDILKDILAGVFILVENQYGVGDIVELGSFKGEVISIGLKTTKIKTDKGQIAIISNRNVVDVINYSLNDYKDIIDIKVSYDSDLDKVEKVLKDLVKDLSNKIGNIKSDFALAGIQSLDDSITYRIEVTTTIQRSNEVHSMALKRIKEVLDKNDIRRK